MSDLHFDLYSVERLHNVRRTLEAGMAWVHKNYGDTVHPPKEPAPTFVDILQHALDELAAAGVPIHKPDCDTEHQVFGDCTCGR